MFVNIINCYSYSKMVITGSFVLHLSTKLHLIKKIFEVVSSSHFRFRIILCTISYRCYGIFSANQYRIRGKREISYTVLHQVGLYRLTNEVQNQVSTRMIERYGLLRTAFRPSVRPFRLIHCVAVYLQCCCA